MIEINGFEHAAAETFEPARGVGEGHARDQLDVNPSSTAQE